MPQPKKKLGTKPGVVSEITDLLSGSEAVVLAEYRGLTVPQVAAIRTKLRETGADADFSVVKNTLFSRAAKDAGIGDSQLDATLNGPTAAIIARTESVAVAKALVDYIAANRNTPLKIKGGVVGGKYATPAQIDALSKVPSREVLIAQMLGSFNAPITGLVGTLNGILSNFVYTLQAITDKKSAEA
jgi:large subunit ribosomal protein L10